MYCRRQIAKGQAHGKQGPHSQLLQHQLLNDVDVCALARDGGNAVSERARQTKWAMLSLITRGAERDHFLPAPLRRSALAVSLLAHHKSLRGDAATVRVAATLTRNRLQACQTHRLIRRLARRGCDPNLRGQGRA